MEIISSLYPFILDWLDLVVRWIHIIVGIAWIGTSFYFNWLDSRLDRDLKDEVDSVDVAFLDATFYSITELPFRDVKLIPHPLVSESIELFKDAPDVLKSKVVFIHFNHTNQLMWNPDTIKLVEDGGFKVAGQGRKY